MLKQQKDKIKKNIKINIIKMLLKENDKKTSFNKPHQKKNKPIRDKKQNNVIKKIKKLLKNILRS